MRYKSLRDGWDYKIVEYCCEGLRVSGEVWGAWGVPAIKHKPKGFYISGCHESLDEAPVKFCPWCGARFVEETKSPSRPKE